MAFFTGNNLTKISLEGGPAITLCNAPAGAGGSWGEDGNIIAALTINTGLSRIPTPVTEQAQGELTHRRVTR